jgi:protein phosphatase slingshot
MEVCTSCRQAHFLGFHFSPLESSTPRRVFTFKPASVRSLWSAVQLLLKILESTAPAPGDWPWLEIYRQMIPNISRSVSVVFLADVAACPMVLRDCGEGVGARPHPPPTRARRTERSAVGVLRTTDGRPPKTNEEFENAIVAQLKKMMFDCDLDTITAKQVGLSPSSRSFP